MVELKLYRPDDLVREYVFSWKVRDERTVVEMQRLVRDSSSSLHDLVSRLEKHIMAQVKNFALSEALPEEQILALIKLIYLQEQLYRRVNIFLPGSDRELLENLLADYRVKYALPTPHPSEMVPQAIKIYNPVLRVKHLLQRMFYRVKK